MSSDASSFMVHHLVSGVLQTDSWTKKQLGRRIAYHLGFDPGGSGADGGVDGVMRYNGKLVVFQAKLESSPLDVIEAERFYSSLKRKQAQVGVLLSGCGYKATFRDRFYEHPDAGEFEIHLLSLEDVFLATDGFARLREILPPVRDISRELDLFRS